MVVVVVVVVMVIMVGGGVVLHRRRIYARPSLVIVVVGIFGGSMGEDPSARSVRRSSSRPPRKCPRNLFMSLYLFMTLYAVS